VLAIADDDAIAGLVVLHLHYGFARARLVREVGTLAHDTVEADHLEPLEPARGLLPVRRLRREGERGRPLLELEPPLRERTAVDGLAVPEQEVEGDERGRSLDRELPDPRLGRMQAHLHRVEI